MFEIIPNWHPIFVNFTIALLSVAVGFYVLAAFMGPSILHRELFILARWNLWLGAGFAIITAMLGFLAYDSVEHDDAGHAAMEEHRDWAIATLAIFLPLAGWSLWRHRAGFAAGPVFVVLMVIGFGVLASTGWHGAEVVFRHGIGVESLPDVDDHVHAAGEGHAHGEDTEDRTHEHETDAPLPATTETGEPLPLTDDHEHDEQEHEHVH